MGIPVMSKHIYKNNNLTRKVFINPTTLSTKRLLSSNIEHILHTLALWQCVCIEFASFRR